MKKLLEEYVGGLVTITGPMVCIARAEIEKILGDSDNLRLELKSEYFPNGKKVYERRTDICSLHGSPYEGEGTTYLSLPAFKENLEFYTKTGDKLKLEYRE